MAEDECPNCGEPLDEDATFCHHCGSDAETGWKPDADYESLELPEEEGESPRRARRALRERLRSLPGPALVAAAWVFFVLYGLSTLKPPLLVLVPAIYLAIMLGILARLAHPTPRRLG